MMKKLLAALLIALLCLGGVAALAEVDADYVGDWELRSVKLFGLEMTSDKLSYTVTIHIHEDGTGLLVKDDNFGMFDMIADGDAYYTMLGPEKMPMAVNAQGLMEATMTAEGLTMDMTLSKAKPGAYDSALALPMLGYWTLEKVELMGFEMDAETFGAAVTVDVYADGYVRIALDGDWYVARLQEQDGGIVAVDAMGNALELGLLADGRMHMVIEEQGLTMDVYLTRNAAAEAAGSTVKCDLCGQSGPEADNHAVGALNLCGSCYGKLFE